MIANALRARRLWPVAIGGLLAGLAGATTMPRPEAPVAKPIAANSDSRTVRVWQPPRGLTQEAIWPHGAPDMGGDAGTPESVLTASTPLAIGGATSDAVFDVTVPTMTIFPPRGRNTGAVIVVFPGGGYKSVVVTSEGTEICDWISAHGVTCVLSKYRVPFSGHHYDKACDCGVEPRAPRALQDAQRTIRLVRSRAAALRIDPGMIGAMGFSAGGYLVAQTSNIFRAAYTPVDGVDGISSRPDFAIAFYPGHLCRPGARLNPAIRPTVRTPPTFLTAAWDDPVDDICNSTLYAQALDDARVPTEVHLFARGGHCLTLRRTDAPTEAWPRLLETWLREIGIS